MLADRLQAKSIVNQPLNFDNRLKMTHLNTVCCYSKACEILTNGPRESLRVFKGSEG